MGVGCYIGLILSFMSGLVGRLWSGGYGFISVIDNSRLGKCWRGVSNFCSIYIFFNWFVRD